MKNLINLIILIFTLVFLISIVAAQDQSSEIQQINEQLRSYNELAKIGQLTSEQTQKALEIAIQRKTLILNMMKSNIDIESLILKKEDIAYLPTSIKDNLEKYAEREGLISIIHIDAPADKPEQESEYIYTLQGEKEFTLYFKNLLDPLVSDELLKIKGYELDKSFFVITYEIIPQPGGGAVYEDTHGEQKVAVIFQVQFPLNENYEIRTEDQVKKIFEEVTENYKENSYSQMTFKFDFYTQEPSQGYDRFLYIRLESPSWGTVGKPQDKSVASISEESFKYHAIAIHTITHELGHNLGIWHANLFTGCKEIQIILNRPPHYLECTKEYGDLYDPMGTGDARHFNAVHKEKLGWIKPEWTYTIDKPGIYKLGAINLPNNAPKIFKLPFKHPATDDDLLYIEYKNYLRSGTNYPYNQIILFHTSYFENRGDTALIPITDTQNYLYAADIFHLTIQDFFQSNEFKITPAGVYEDGVDIKIEFEKDKFIRGDVNRDGNVDITDAINLLDTMFKGEESIKCYDAADANDNGIIDISDAIFILHVLYLGKDMPEPFPEKDFDLTSDEMNCDKIN